MRRCTLVLVGLASCAHADKGAAKPAGAAAAPTPTVDDGAPPTIDGDRNIIRNGTFEDGVVAPWRATTSGAAQGTAEVSDGAYCMQVGEPGDTAWDAQLRHRALSLVDGHHYVVEFTAWADRPTKMRPRVGEVGPPYDEYWAAQVDVGDAPQRYAGHFVKRRGDEKAAELTFQLGGPLAPEQGVRVCIDDVALSDPDYEPPPPSLADSAPKIRVNQVGYLPRAPKYATLRSGATAPLSWALLDAEEKVLAEGETTVFGDDAASGEHVHRIDFSSYDKRGEGLRLRVGEDTSFPFAIGDGIYKRLKYDALAYFYHNRSGVPIEMPYAGGKEWTRPAGHPGDKAVKCLPDLGCKGTVDASGGWYDAGDHGKYVVNAGITVWTLLNAWERMQHLGGKPKAFADGTANIPEKNNGAPDLLDEVRFELEMMLRLQVPQGEKWAGMAWHKLHEEKWTDMPKGPHETTAERFLHRPSTSATLNFAAMMAQAARVYRKVDPAFSQRCRKAAEVAWAAAKKTPDLLAPGSDNVGGGPYDDTNLADEHYWAAVELYVTTGGAEYDKAMKASPLHLKMGGPGPAHGSQQSSMSWQQVGSLGTITLAVVPSKAGDDAVKKARAAIVDVADAYAKIAGEQGYRVPLGPDGAGRYPWGSNSLVLNNMVVLGLAHAFSKDEAHLGAMLDGMDYLLGRNPMSQSYVSGYGSIPLLNPHHRFWAKQKDEVYPPPPPGAVSGGPNSSVQDPYAQSVGLLGCPAQTCFVDHIESWSTNEVAINWNAPLVWVVAYLDEQAR